jgi:hypothetical protein
MIGSRLRALVVASLAVAVSLVATPTAEATLKIRASVDGFATFIEAVDEGAGDSAGTTGITGLLSATFTFPGVTVHVSTGTSKPLVGNPGLSEIDIGVTGAFTGAGTVIIDVTDTDFGPPGTPSGFGMLVADLSSNRLATFQAFIDNHNLHYGGVPAPGAIGTAEISTGIAANAPPGVTDAVAFGFGTAIAPYSMSGRTVLTGTAGQSISVDNNITFTVPAPAGVVLALTGLPLVGFGHWWRRRKAEVKAL